MRRLTIGQGLFLAIFLGGAGCGAAGDPAAAGSSQTFGVQKNFQAAPVTKLSKSGRPANPTASSTAAFKFSCNLGTCTYRCSLDSKAYKSCKSPKTYKNLAEGTHAFKVKAYYGGVSDRTPAKYYWLVSYPGSWTATSTANAPGARYYQTAVWTGSEMIVWGGQSNNFTFTGARYSPVSNSWIWTSTVNAPATRFGHTAVWTGSKMIIWGGSVVAVGPVNTGGLFTP